MHLDRSIDSSGSDETLLHRSRVPKKEQAQSQGEVAYAELKRRIIHCELEPGEHMTEAQLVGETGIGKTPIREALTRLIQEGLAHSIPGHGYEVTPITLGDVQDLFSFRLIVEPAAAQLAAGHVVATDLRRLDELCATHYFIGDTESEARYLHANYVFHTTIADSSGNHRLASAVRSVLDESERLFHLSAVLKNRSDEVIHEHKDLIDALIAGDGETARRMALTHITASQRLVLEALMTNSSLLSVHIVPPRSLKNKEQYG
jgi:DNA-binding GntR family transcriptional regulator